MSHPGKAQLADLYRRARSFSQPPTQPRGRSSTHTPATGTADPLVLPGRTRSETKAYLYSLTPVTRSRSVGRPPLDSSPVYPIGKPVHKPKGNTDSAPTQPSSSGILDPKPTSSNSDTPLEKSESDKEDSSESESQDPPEPFEPPGTESESEPEPEESSGPDSGDSDIEASDSEHTDSESSEEEPDMAQGATQNQIRLVIQEMLGPLGPLLNEQGEIRMVQVGENHVQEGTSGTLIEKLGAMGKKQDVTRPPAPWIFHGREDEDAADFRDMLQDYLQQGGYNEEADKLRLTKMFLAGSAKSWFKQRDPQFATFDEFVTGFNEKYVTGEAANVMKDKLLSRRQGQGEDPVAYAEDICKKGLQLEWARDRIKDHIIAGLLPHFKEKVILNNPATLEATITFLNRIKHFGPQPNDMSVIQQSLTKILTQMKDDKEDKKLAIIQHQVDHDHPVQKICPHIQAALPHDVSPMSYVVETSTQRPPPRRQRQPKPPPPPPLPQQPSLPIIINTTQPAQVPFQAIQQPTQLQPQQMTFQSMGPQQTRPNFPRPRQKFQNTPGQGNCFLCSSPNHWKAQCPMNQAANPLPVQQQPQTNYWPAGNIQSGFQRRKGPRSRFNRGQQSPRGRPIYKAQGNY